ncbi:MAG: GNAT family N-acetyltransferase [Aerococcus sp.]|nr:GNAT family N-acetyltransferase [Aerococcus sp.]
MPMFTFNDLFLAASEYDDTELFSAAFNRYTPADPGVNAIWLDFSPELAEWDILLDYFEDYAFELAEKGILLTNYSFRWPDNTGIQPDTLEAMAEDGFQIGQYVLLTAPTVTPKAMESSSLTLLPITSANWDDYNALQQQGNAVYGTHYQAAKRDYYAFTRDWPSVTQYGAYQGQTLVGGFELIHTAKAIELDQLIIAPAYQNQGLGTELMRQLIAQVAPTPLIMKVDREDEAVMHFYEELHCEAGSTQIIAMAPFSAEFVEELKKAMPQ